MAEQEQKTPQQTVEFKRQEDFETLYANNVQAEISVWDYKIIFGILDQSVQPNRVMQHTSIILPWAQAKLCQYYLQIAIAPHEVQNGKIEIPPSVRPPDPTAVVAGQTFRQKPSIR